MHKNKPFYFFDSIFVPVYEKIIFYTVFRPLPAVVCFSISPVFYMRQDGLTNGQ